MVYRVKGAQYSQAPSADQVEWQLRGLCRSGRFDPDLWMPGSLNHEERAEPAKDLCLDCPVMVRCGQWAIEHHERFGVWGGLSEGDRQAIWDGRTKKRPYHRQISA